MNTLNQRSADRKSPSDPAAVGARDSAAAVGVRDSVAAVGAPDSVAVNVVQALAPSSKAVRYDVLCCIALTVLVAVVFFKTVFLGLPISRIGLIAEWDSLFSALRRGATLHIDPSAVLLALPTYTTIAQQYHAGHLPLWNSLSAFGAPLVGDVQATVFSPLRALFNLLPSMRTYNLQLVAQVEIAALTAFILCRNLGAGRIPSFAAAASYALCPFVLWYLELQSGVGFVFNPMVMWLFVRAARLGTARSAIFAGLGAGVTIMMGHPETSFFAILFAVAVSAALMWPGFVQTARAVGIAGLAALCTCAPTFFPFIEFAKNSDCYKYSISESAFMPWQAMVANMVSPLAGGASPFLGVLVGAVALAALVRGARFRAGLTMAGLALATFILAGKLFPFSLVSHTAPFNYLITVYAVPLFLLGVASMFALGLTNLGEKTTSDNRATCTIFTAAAALALLPGILQAGGFDWNLANFDMTLPSTVFSASIWRRDLIVAAIAVVSSLVAMRFEKRQLVVLAFALLNTISLLCATKLSLPVQPKFELPKLAVMETLQRSGERVIACGSHLAKPDVNLLYGIDDVRSINAMLPPRYVSFVKACGASADQFTQWFGDELTPVVDYGSVRYVISQTPVTSTIDAPRSHHALRSQRFEQLGKIVSGKLATDVANRQVTGFINWKFDQPVKQASITLSDANGTVVWFSDRVPVNSSELRQSVRIPLPTAHWQNYSIGAVFDDATLDVCDVPPPAVADADTRFKLLREFDGGIRLYENTTAFPRAFFTSEYVVASSKEDALRHVNEGAVELVLETAPAFASASGAPVDVQTTLRTSDEVALRYSSNRQGVIVVTDTFYPGWKAYLDGKPAPIVRANYLFRGVVVPAGQHTLTMRYSPETFTVGVLLFLAFWGFAVIAFVRKAL